MRLTGLARRYARALFEAAKGANAIDTVESDLGLITYSLQSVPRLQEVLSHPLIPPARKKEIVADIFNGKIQQITLSFLYLLIDKRREDLTVDAESEYVALANEYRQITQVMVTSVVPLTDDEMDRLRARLEGLTHNKVELQTKQDPDLIGGLVVQIGDTIIDGSIRGQLAAMKDRLLGRE